ncbi:MAG TPA: methyltransferase domain-containing protein [Stellaceae bacterium]
MAGTMPAPDLARRSFTPELMDTEPVPFESFRDCLRELEWLTRWSMGYRPTLQWIARAARRLPPGSTLSVLDVGCGYGDMLRRIARWGARAGVRLELTGVDLNPWSARAAREATPPDYAIRYETSDIFDFAPDRHFHCIVSAIFTHHLDDAQLVAFLQWMERHATLGWFISDLHRHAVPYWFLRALPAIVPLHRFVAHDGPVSVSRCLRAAEWRAAIAAAGIDAEHAVRIRWHVPFRWGIERWQPGYATR